MMLNDLQELSVRTHLAALANSFPNGIKHCTEKASLANAKGSRFHADSLVRQSRLNRFDESDLRQKTKISSES